MLPLKNTARQNNPSAPKSLCFRCFALTPNSNLSDFKPRYHYFQEAIFVSTQCLKYFELRLDEMQSPAFRRG